MSCLFSNAEIIYVSRAHLKVFTDKTFPTFRPNPDNCVAGLASGVIQQVMKIDQQPLIDLSSWAFIAAKENLYHNKIKKNVEKGEELILFE